jgi:hypothetical protein
LIVALSAFSAGALRASAQDNIGTVLIVRVPKDGAVVARIRAELEANDFWVREVGPDSSSARAPLPLLAANANARAALRMHPTRAAIELWVASEGGASGGGEVVRLPGDDHDDALLAVRATEAMRARGLRLPKRSETAAAVGGGAVIAGGTPSTTTSDPNAARPEAATANERADAERARRQAEERAAAERAAAEAQRQAEAEKQEAQHQAEAQREAETRAEAEREAEEEREAEAQRQAEREAEESETEQLARSDERPSLLFIEVGPAIGLSPRRSNFSVAAFANVRVQPSASWSISGFAFLPFLGGDVEYKPAGDANLRTFIFGGMFDLHAAVSGIDLSAGAGTALLITRMRADAADPNYESHQIPDEITGALLVRAGVHFSVAPHIRLGARVLFGLAVPQLELKVDDQVAATWGRPFALGVISVDFGLPSPER